MTEGLKKLTKEEFKLLLGKSAYNKIVKDVSKKIVEDAKRLSSQKLTSINVVDAGINLESKELYIHAQGAWRRSGALIYTVRWPLKIGSPKIKFLEDAGNIPD